MTFDLRVNKADSICARVIKRKRTVGDSIYSYMCLCACMMCGIVLLACVLFAQTKRWNVQRTVVNGFEGRSISIVGIWLLDM